MRPKVFLFGLAFSALKAHGQTPSQQHMKKMADSIKALYLDEAAIRSPALRQAMVSTDFFSKGTVTGKLNGREVYDGQATMARTVALFRMPLTSWGKNSLSATFSFVRQKMAFSEISPSALADRKAELGFDEQAGGLSVLYTRVDSLFGRPVVYLANASAMSDALSPVRRFSGLLGASLSLKQNRNTSLRLALFVNVDPFAQLPVFPLVTYWHKFQSSGLELSLDPSKTGLRKQLSKDLWATLGAGISGSASFLKLNYPSIPSDVSYSMMDIKSGAGLETRLFRKLMLGIEGGVMKPLSARAFEKGSRSGDYFFENKIQMRPYLNISLSMLPVKLF